MLLGSSNVDADLIVRDHIAALHEYNEVKDLTMDLISRLAHVRAQTVQTIVAEYDLPRDE